jgi:hypothetical protein
MLNRDTGRCCTSCGTEFPQGLSPALLRRTALGAECLACQKARGMAGQAKRGEEMAALKRRADDLSAQLLEARRKELADRVARLQRRAK